MKKKTLVFIFIVMCILLSAGSFAVGKYISKNASTNKNTATNKVANSDKNVAADKNTETQKISDNKSKLDVFDKRSEQIWEKAQMVAKQEGVIAEEAKDDGSYNIKQPIRLSKNFYITLEKSDKVIYINGRSYVVADVSFLNVSEKDYYSDLSNFTLQDESGYTYKPDSMYKVTGDIEGNVLNGKGTRRGQIAFNVPYSQTNFTLTFNCENLCENTYKIQSINFKMNFPNKQN